jgi:hypothetical protein
MTRWTFVLIITWQRRRAANSDQAEPSTLAAPAVTAVRFAPLTVAMTSGLSAASAAPLGLGHAEAEVEVPCVVRVGTVAMLGSTGTTPTITTTAPERSPPQCPLTHTAMPCRAAGMPSLGATQGFDDTDKIWSACLNLHCQHRVAHSPHPSSGWRWFASARGIKPEGRALGPPHLHYHSLTDSNAKSMAISGGLVVFPCLLAMHKPLLTQLISLQGGCAYNSHGLY